MNLKGPLPVIIFKADIIIVTNVNQNLVDLLHNDIT